MNKTKGLKLKLNRKKKSSAKLNETLSCKNSTSLLVFNDPRASHYDNQN